MVDQDRREGEYLSLEEARDVIASATDSTADEIADKAEDVEFPPPDEGELESEDDS